MAFSDDQRKIMQMIRDAAIKYGVDPNHALTVASIESEFNPNAKNGMHTGLFQFGPAEWKTYGTGTGSQMGGLDVDNQVLGFKNYQDAARKQMAQVLGREPTLNELYLAHQQGVGGALSLIQNSQRPATSVVPGGNILANAGKESDTSQQFADRWYQKYGAHSALVNDQPLPTPNSGNVSTAYMTNNPDTEGVQAQMQQYLAKNNLLPKKDDKAKPFDYAGLTQSGLKMMSADMPTGGGGPPQMPVLPAHRPDMNMAGMLNPFANQTQAPMPGRGLLSPASAQVDPSNDPQMRRLLQGLLTGG